MVERIAISLEAELLKKFDAVIRQQGYSSRSEAVRDLIREMLVRKEWETGSQETVGAVVLVYEFETLKLAQKLTELEHSHFARVVSSMHVHIDEENCLEIIVLRGKARDISRLADALVSVKGVKHGKFVAATTGKNLP